MKSDRKRLEGIACGFMPARILLTACELDLFSHLARRALSAEELSEAAGTDPEGTRRLLNALAGLKLLQYRNGRYRNTEATFRHLVRGRREFLGNIMLHRQSMWERWSHLTDIVRSGKVPPRGRNKEYQRRFMGGMADLGYLAARQVVRALKPELKETSRLLDVGGGPAVYACAFARAKRSLQVTVLDLPGPLKYARETLRSEGLTGRVRLRAADAQTVRSFGRSYDLVFMSNFIHCFKEPVAREMIRKAARALRPGGYLAVKDFFINSQRTGPVFAAVFSINMLVAAAGDCYTRAEVSSWMRKAGVRPHRYVSVAEHSAILVGRREDGDS